MFGLPDMTLDQMREYSRKMIADLSSDPPMVDVHDRERQAHAVVHELLVLIDDQVERLKSEFPKAVR